MKILNNIGFTSYQLCFLESLFCLPTQGRRIAVLERMQLVIAWFHISLNDVGNGLLSIVDLVDSSALSQKSLFNNEHGFFLKSLFKTEVIAKPQPIPVVLSNTWLIVSKSIINSRNTTIGIDYIYKITAKQSRENRYYLKIFEYILNLVDGYFHLLVKSNGEGNDYSENEILRIIWSSILEQLFPPKEHHITVKTGETINIISQEHKEDLYNNSSNIKAFKIDIRADNNPCSLLHCRRDTYYTPPKNKVGKIPLHMFGSPSISSSITSFLSLQKRTDYGNKNIQCDIYGWGERETNGKWYNNVTGKVQDESP